MTGEIVCGMDSGKTDEIVCGMDSGKTDETVEWTIVDR